jgi:hypothetical protein
VKFEDKILSMASEEAVMLSLRVPLTRDEIKANLLRGLCGIPDEGWDRTIDKLINARRILEKDGKLKLIESE